MIDDKLTEEAATSFYRHAHPAVVAMQLSHEHGIRVFPTHGMRKTKDGSLECNCMPWRRRNAKQTGEPVIACPTPGKMPAIKDWPNTATTDTDTLSNWAKRSPTNNFSAVTGSKSRVWVLDIDGDLGQENLDALETEHGEIPATWSTQSGSGHGSHYWFRIPENIVVRNSASQIAPGIDVRGENGQILLPGSMHKSGRRYTWIHGRAPDEVTLAEAPEWLLHLALEACSKTRLLQSVSPEPEGPRQPKTAVEPSHHDRSLVIGDGEGRGGFHAPINGIAVKFFATFGPLEPSEPLKTALRKAITEAPCGNHDPSDIERYASDAYLDEAINSAREYIMEIGMKT